MTDFAPMAATRSLWTAAGNACVNGGGFDLPGQKVASGMIALVTPDGSARQVADGIAFPNGMVLRR